jgi:hypothetical protein
MMGRQACVHADDSRYYLLTLIQQQHNSTSLNQNNQDVASMHPSSRSTHVTMSLAKNSPLYFPNSNSLQQQY